MNITSLKNAIASAFSGLTLQTAGKTVISTADLTRPADTAVYAPLDVVSDSSSAGFMLTFPNMARVNGGSGYVTKAVLQSDSTTMQCSFRLHLYTSTATTVNKTDNAPLVQAYADRNLYVGYIDFDMTGPEGTGSCVKSVNSMCRLAYTTESTVTALYGVLEMRSFINSQVPYVPASGQKFSIKLTAEQN
jgi:hypothetical protein